MGAYTFNVQWCVQLDDEFSYSEWSIYSSIFGQVLKTFDRTLCGMKEECLLSHCEIWGSCISDDKDFSSDVLPHAWVEIDRHFRDPKMKQEKCTSNVKEEC